MLIEVLRGLLQAHSWIVGGLSQPSFIACSVHSGVRCHPVGYTWDECRQVVCRTREGQSRYDVCVWCVCPSHGNACAVSLFSNFLRCQKMKVGL
jgi:hypothetical protein